MPAGRNCAVFDFSSGHTAAGWEFPKIRGLPPNTEVTGKHGGRQGKVTLNEEKATAGWHNMFVK